MMKSQTTLLRVAYREERNTFAALGEARAREALVHTLRPLFDAWVIAYDALRHAQELYEGED